MCRSEEQGVGSGRDCAHVGTGVSGNSLYSLLNFTTNVKLLMKAKFISLEKNEIIAILHS
jgi:hypothetical protein